MGLSSSFSNLKHLRSFIISIPPRQTPYVEALSAIPLSSTPTSIVLNEGVLRKRSSNIDVIELGGRFSNVGISDTALSSGSNLMIETIRSSVPPVKDIKKSLKKAHKLEEIVWTGRGGMGSWKLFKSGGLGTLKIEFEPLNRTRVVGVNASPTQNLIEMSGSSVTTNSSITSSNLAYSRRRASSSASSMNFSELSMSGYQSALGLQGMNANGRRDSKTSARNTSIGMNATTPPKDNYEEASGFRDDEGHWEMDESPIMLSTPLSNSNGNFNPPLEPGSLGNKKGRKGSLTIDSNKIGSSVVPSPGRRKSLGNNLSGKNVEKIVIGSVHRGRN
jgi:hypothetical protein